MKRSKYILIVFFVTILVSSCKSEDWWFENTRIVGKVTDYCNGQPIPNVTIQLFRGSKGVKTGTDYQYLKSCYTDANGFYEIKFSAIPKQEYSFLLDDSRETFEWQVTNIHKGKEQEINIPVKIYYEPQLYLTVKNNSPFDNNDLLSIVFQNPAFYTSNNLYNPWNITGQNINFNLKLNVPFSYCDPQLVKFNWTVRKNNITNSFSDSVLCYAASYNTYTLNY